MNQLVIIKGKNVFTDTYEISKGLKLDHRSVTSLLMKHRQRRTFANIEAIQKKTPKKLATVYLLTEVQATYLITLMANSEETMDFKELLVEEFYQQRLWMQHQYTQAKNAEWLAKRGNTKVMRRECTDMIQKFVAYAISQGSKSAEKYYMNLSRMEVTGLFLIEQKYPNTRDIMSIRQLNLIEMADEAIAVALEEGMNEGLHYKDCYKKAKEKIELLEKIFPRSPLPLLLAKQTQE